MEPVQGSGHAMEHAQEPEFATSGDPLPGLRGVSRLGLRSRLLGAILVVVLATCAVGLVGINRMSALSGKANQVYTDGAIPLDGLRTLQAQWWEYSSHFARTNIPSLPATTLASERELVASSAQ